MFCLFLEIKIVFDIHRVGGGKKIAEIVSDDHDKVFVIKIIWEWVWSFFFMRWRLGMDTSIII